MSGNWKSALGILLLLGAILVNSSPMESNGTLPDRCVNMKPTFADYTPRGSEYEIGNITVYESDNRSAKRLLIAVYDIYGFSTNMKQVVDMIANTYDFRVVLPDFFRGQPWDESYIPEDPQEVIDWATRNGSWENVVNPDFRTILNEFKTVHNITEVGVFGMCWGGFISTLAAINTPEIKAAGLVHPGLVNNSDAENVKVPMFLLPSADEPDMLPFYEVLKQKFGHNSGHRRFDDMFHGFAAARGNFSDPLNMQRVEQVVDILGLFFNYNLTP